jgi:hypothetical protein
MVRDHDEVAGEVDPAAAPGFGQDGLGRRQVVQIHPGQQVQAWRADDDDRI